MNMNNNCSSSLLSYLTAMIFGMLIEQIPSFSLENGLLDNKILLANIRYNMKIVRGLELNLSLYFPLYVSHCKQREKERDKPQV